MTRARVLVALFVANCAAVILIWWVGLDAASFDRTAAWLNAAGRITGLVGTYLILVQLILRTHVPWLVGAFSKDQLKSWHTKNAYAAFGLLGAHGILQLVGYSLDRGVDVVTELGLLVAYYEGVLLAIGSFVLLSALTVLALERFRHRIPWPTWRALHLYAYVAVALSVPHQIATGSDFIGAPLAVAYWTALLVAALGVIVAARVPPVWRAVTALGRPHPAIVALAALVIAIYLAGMVRLSPATARSSAESRSPSGGPATSPPAATVVPGASAEGGATAVAIDGDVIETPYGSTQVRLILSGRRITDVQPIRMPSATKNSKTISNSVESWLRKRAIAAQSAQFDVLSGATYTSRAYQSSLASALRAAGLRE